MFSHLLSHDFAAAQMDGAVGSGREVMVMGGRDDGYASCVREVRQQEEYTVAVAGIEVAGRLVRQDQPRPAVKRPGDGDALHLAAGELPGIVRGAAAESHHLEEAARVVADGAEGRRKGDVPRAPSTTG